VPPVNNQWAVPPGAFVKLAPRFSVLPNAAPPTSTPLTDPVAPCVAASYVPLYPVTVTMASALAMSIATSPLLSR